MASWCWKFLRVKTLIVQCSQSIYNVSILLAALLHAAVARYALVWIEQVFHKDLMFRTWGFLKKFSPLLYTTGNLYFFLRLSICYRSCIFHPCCLLPHFPLLHFQRPRCFNTSQNWDAVSTPYRLRVDSTAHVAYCTACENDAQVRTFR